MRLLFMVVERSVGLYTYSVDITQQHSACSELKRRALTPMPKILGVCI